MLVNKINFMSKPCSIINLNAQKSSDDKTIDQEFDLIDHPYIDTFERESCYRGNLGLCDDIEDEFETFEDYGGLSDAYII